MEQTTKQVTLEEKKAAMGMILAVTEAIREAKRIPAGHLYAILMGKIDLAGFEGMIALIVDTGLVKRTAYHELVWIGPEITKGENSTNQEN